MKHFISIFILSLALWLNIAYATEKLPDNLISLSSTDGVILLKRNTNQNTIKLLSHFTTQKTLTYCGIATAVMILNSSMIDAPSDSQHLPYHYFNQENFFNRHVMEITTPDEVSKNGINLLKLSKIIEANGLKATPIFANEINPEKFRALIKTALHENKFVIVNFLRSKIKQDGGLHHSPIAAYDETTDRFLILDVSRYKYPAYWVKSDELWNAVIVYVNNTYHGIIIVENPNQIG